MSKKSIFLMFSIMNVVMATAMSVSASVIHADFSYKTVALIPLGYAIGMILSYLIPLGRIGEWGAKVLHAKHPAAVAVSSSLIPAAINTAVIGFFMSLINIPLEIGAGAFIISYLSDLWKLYIVGIAVASITNPLATKAALTFDNRSKK